MKSSRPYLIRALYEWISDSELTPHIVVDADAPGARFPSGVAEDGKIVFNIGAQAVSGLNLGNADVVFDARFDGVSQRVVIPIGSVLAVYARENGQGMMFPPDQDGSPSEPSPDGTKTSRLDRGHLKVIK